MPYAIFSDDAYRDKLAKWGCKMKETDAKSYGQYTCSLCTKRFKKPSLDTLKVRLHAIVDITSI